MALTNSEDIKQLGTILSIWAHPDDESFMCAGIMSAALKNGQRVACVTATRGEAGVRDESRWPAGRLAEIRTSELREAFKVLGITKHHWLDYPDGGCAKISDETAVARLVKYINIYSPDTILTFGSEGFTGHDDHKAVSRWACKAAAQADKPVNVFCAVERQVVYDKYLKEADRQLNIYFNIDTPPCKTRNECDIYFELTPDLFSLKRKALCAMPSQTEALVSYFKPEEFQNIFDSEAFIKC